MKFHLTGNVCWAVGSCHDDRSEKIDMRFDALNEDKGIEKARSEIEKRHNKYRHNTDYVIGAQLFAGKKMVWEIDFKDECPALDAIPAQLARPAIPAHFVEKRFTKKRR